MLSLNYYWTVDDMADLSTAGDGYTDTLERAKSIAQPLADSLVCGRAEIEEMVIGNKELRGWIYRSYSDEGWKEI